MYLDLNVHLKVSKGDFITVDNCDVLVDTGRKLYIIPMTHQSAVLYPITRCRLRLHIFEKGINNSMDI